MTRQRFSRMLEVFVLSFVMITIISLAGPNSAVAENKPKALTKFTEYKEQAQKAEKAAEELKKVITAMSEMYDNLPDQIEKDKDYYDRDGRTAPHTAEYIMNSSHKRIKYHYKQTKIKYDAWVKASLQTRKAAEALMKELNK
jgi:ABC-type nitrate/sulfonate/bicarbonate transport system substrate-binding protein